MHKQFKAFEFALYERSLFYDKDVVTYEYSVYASKMPSLRFRSSKEHDQTSGTSCNLSRVLEQHGGPAGGGERRTRASTARPVRIQQRGTGTRHLARRQAQPEPPSRRTSINGIDESDEGTATPTAIFGEPPPQQVAREVHHGDAATVSEPRRLRNSVGHRSFALARTELSHLARDDSFHWQPHWKSQTARREQQQTEYSVPRSGPSDLDSFQLEEGTGLYRNYEAQIRTADGQRAPSPDDQGLRRSTYRVSGVSQFSPRRYGCVMGD